jgi:hypothetical protein
MQIDWFFGPDKQPFTLDAAGELTSPLATPFHGIVGLGLRQLLVERHLAADAWLRSAHLIFAEEIGEADVTDELVALRACAADSDALSFGDSAAAVRTYLEERWGGSVLHATAWNVKEGHTSSVWHVRLHESTHDPSEFAVNVGRDKAGSANLASTSERMRQIQARQPDVNMAAVLDIRTVQLMRGRGPADVVVTQNEWAQDSYEIHTSATYGRYVLVERFLTSSDLPAEIVSVYGRFCSEDERVQIDHDLALFCDAATAAGADATVIDLSHGDAVWDGSGAVVVAIS